MIDELAQVLTHERINLLKKGMNNMKIIDFARKGNVVRFYLGADELTEWYGDDWDDRPYEYNAGTVYSKFVSGYKDVSFPFSCSVLEPQCGECNSPWSKEDMVAGRVPCIIVVPEDILAKSWNSEKFSDFVGSNKVKKYYFGDSMAPDEIGLPSEMQ